MIKERNHDTNCHREGRKCEKKFKPCLSEKVRCNAGHAAQFIM